MSHLIDQPSNLLDDGLGLCDLLPVLLAQERSVQTGELVDDTREDRRPALDCRLVGERSRLGCGAQRNGLGILGQLRPYG